MFKHSLSALSFFVILTLVSVGTGSAAANRESLTVLSSSDWSSALGRGFDSHLGRIAEPCIQGEIVLRGQREGALSYHYNDSFEDYFKTVSGRLSAGVNLLLVGGSVSVDYFARVARSELSTSFTAQFDSKLGTAVLDRRSLSVEGNAAAGLSPLERRKLCGDEFVAEAEVGTRLLISSTFHFTSVEEFQRFVRTVKVSALFGLIKSKKTFVEETRRFSQSAYMKVDALQIGGSPDRLETLKRQTGSTICRFDEIDSCRQLLESLFAYAGAADGYMSQFSVPYQPQELALLGFRTMRYETSGHDALSVPPASAEDADIKQIVRLLTLEFARQLSLHDRIVVILSTPVSEVRRAEVQHLRDLCDENLENLERALWVCRTNDLPATCRAARDDEARSRQPVSFADLHF